MVQPQSSDPAPGVDLEAVHRIYLLGIGGTGMGAFAGLLKQAGYEVAGSDEALYPPMSDMLQRWNIQALRGYEAGHLRQPFNGDPDLVIVGNVIRRLNPEAEALRASGIPYLSFPQALGEIFLSARESIVITGTHGKTTTSALVAHLLTQAGRDPSALIGGVSLNLLEEGGGSFRIGGGRHFVVEGDEYDTAYFDKGPKFLHYRPKLAVLTSLEFDHADIYRDLPHYESAFARFVALLPKGGHLAVAESHPRAVSLAARAACRVETYGIDRGDLQTRGLSFRPEGARFEMWSQSESLGVFQLPIFGAPNVENALGAASVALAAGLSPEELRSGLATFRGVRRRQELLGAPGGEPRGVTVIDDFAHHPTAVRATLAAVRARFPDRHLWALFEPRSNTSRRKIYQDEYSKAFDLADRVVIVAPQGGSPVPEEERLDPQALASAIGQRGKDALYFETVDALVERISDDAKPGEVVVLMSNGSFGGLAQKLMQRLNMPG